MIKSKEVGEKTYNNIDSYMAPKKGQAGVQADNTMPSFMTKDAKSTNIDPSVTEYVKAEGAPINNSDVDYDQTQKNAAKMVEAKAKAAEAEEEDGDLPF